MAKSPEPKQKHIILGVHITDRLKEVPEVQKVLSAYGHCIKTRLGLHEVQEGCSAPNGILILETVGPEAPVKELAARLSDLEGVEVKAIVFEHPPLPCETGS